MTADLELAIDPAEKLCLQQDRVDPAAIARAIEAAQSRVLNEPRRRLRRQVAIAAGEVHASDAEFADLAVRPFLQVVLGQNHIRHIGKRRADRHWASWPQALATGIRARLRRAVGVDDLTAAPRPGLHECRRKGLSRRHDEATDRRRQVDLRLCGERRQQNRRAEEHGDFCLDQQRHKVWPRADLIFRQQDNRGPRHPGGIHLRNAAVVAQGGRQRGGISPGHEIEGVGVSACQVDVARVWTLHALGAAGRPTGVEKRCQSLSGIVEPGRRTNGPTGSWQAQDIAGRQVAKLLHPACQHQHRLGVLKHVLDQGLCRGGIEKQHHPSRTQHPQMRGDDMGTVLWHRHGHHLIRPTEVLGHSRCDAIGGLIQFGIGPSFVRMRDLERGIGRIPGGRSRKHFPQPTRALLVWRLMQVPIPKHIGQPKPAGWLAGGAGIASNDPIPPPGCHRRQKHHATREGCCHGRGSHVFILGWRRRKAAKRQRSKYRSIAPLRRTSSVTQ